jgi:hypothetical protein
VPAAQPAPDTPSQKPARLSKTAGTLYQANHIEAICAKNDDNSKSWCMGFIAGVADAAQEAANASGTCVFKLPRTIEGFGLRATVLTNLKFHPSPVERSGAEAVVAALQRSHPC